MRPRKPPCRCDAYPFPHRLLGGKCCGERDDEEAADRWLSNMLRRGGRLNEDERLDDPRHGQAKELNT